ncbi:MAG: Proteasome accessory factor [Frankiales bacterium]|nr:Proteasome accessory factor [Frankiales bacterium]
MSGSLDQLPRLLALVPYLLKRPGVPFATAAADFGITEDRLRKDLNLLWLCGLPGHYPGDLIEIEFEGDTITLSDAQGVDRPLRLTVDEALALVVALRTLAETPGLADPEPVLRALAKVEEAAGAAALPAARVQVALEGEGTVLPVVRDALERGQALHLTYWTAGRDETTDRDVDPVRLVTAEGQAYLEAWCRRAEGVRVFHLGRVEAVRVLDEPSRPPAGLPSRDLSQGLFQPAPEDTVVTLALEPGAAWVADFYPCDAVEELGDGRQVVTLRTSGTAWVRRLALSLGASGRVLSPPELAQQVREDARTALAAYSEQPST